MKTAFAILFLLLAPAVALPQTTKKLPVAVSHHGDDLVGRSVSFALMESILASQSFRYVDDEITPKRPRIVVHMVSVDTTPGSTTSVRSSIAITIVYDSLRTAGLGAYITSAIMNCGRDRVDSCAKNTLVTIDQAVEQLRKKSPDLWNTL